MVVVDFSNPFLREYFPKWLKAHGESLEKIGNSLKSWAEKAREQELADAKSQKRKPRPLAVVFDIDEVLLCNTHLNGYRGPGGLPGSKIVDFHVADFFTDRETGKPWGRGDTGDPPLPGAVELLRGVEALGIKPFFVTGRLESIRDITIEDFRRAGFTRGKLAPGARLTPSDLTLEKGVLVMCPDREYPAPGQSIRPFKEKERALIEKTHRIVLNVGDQPSDLGLHGDVQYYLPNPFYLTY
jgi:predicted secreted acid phosphatase